MNHWRAEPFYIWWDAMAEYRALHVSDPLVLAVEEHAGAVAVDVATANLVRKRSYRGLDQAKSLIGQRVPDFLITLNHRNG
jgi:hypothetical protein